MSIKRQKPHEAASHKEARLRPTRLQRARASGWLNGFSVTLLRFFFGQLHSVVSSFHLNLLQKQALITVSRHSITVYKSLRKQADRTLLLLPKKESGCFAKR